MDLYHGQPYLYPEGKECRVVRYHRDFTAEEVATYPKNYRSWYVPFDYTVSETDLEKFKFYKIHMIAGSENEEGGEVQDVTKVYIFITKVSAGTKLAGNRPYVIVPNEADLKLIIYEFSFKDSLKGCADDNTLPLNYLKILFPIPYFLHKSYCRYLKVIYLCSKKTYYEL